MVEKVNTGKLSEIEKIKTLNATDAVVLNVGKDQKQIAIQDFIKIIADNIDYVAYNLALPSRERTITGGWEIANNAATGQVYNLSVESSVNTIAGTGDSTRMLVYAHTSTGGQTTLGYLPISEVMQSIAFTYPANGTGRITVCATSGYSGTTKVQKVMFTKGTKDVPYFPNSKEL